MLVVVCSWKKMLGQAINRQINKNCRSKNRLEVTCSSKLKEGFQLFYGGVVGVSDRSSFLGM